MSPTKLVTSFDTDYFISRAGADRDLAVTIASILTKAGHSVLIQDWDFGHKDFVSMMDAALHRCRRTITLLSHSYLQSEFCGAEWRALFAEDPRNWSERLVLFRVDTCQPRGLLSLLAYTDFKPTLGSESLLASVVLASLSSNRDAGAELLLTAYRHRASSIVDSHIRPTPTFIGRDAAFEAIDQALAESSASSKQKVVVLHGMAGAGKTAAAQEYCWTRRERYSGVWFINGSSEGTIAGDLVRLGGDFIRGMEASIDPRAGAVVVLSTILPGFAEQPWLLLVDDVRDELMLRRWLPLSGAHVVATSRVTSWSADVVPVT